MPGTKGHSGGKRPGAGRRPTYKSVQLTEEASRALAYFIDDLNLDPREARVIASTILCAALVDDRDKWADLFGNRLLPAK